jgi:WD40 domain-containing protein
VQLRAAQARGRTATARQPISEAQSTVLTDPRLGLRLAEAAVALDPGPEMQTILAQLIRNNPYAGTLEPEQGQVDDVAYAPDGRTLATANQKNTVTLYDMGDPHHHPRPLGAPLAGPGRRAYDVAFAPDARTLAAAGISIMLWDIADSARARVLGAPLPVDGGTAAQVTFTPDGRTLVAGEGNGIVERCGSGTSPTRTGRANAGAR